ncbi:MAG: DUF3226 domain-containing protein [Candidatus Margulisiibacteriota bacterium]|jgi:hypothetical protein
MNKTITSDYLLAVEGIDECNFFAKLLTHLNIPDIQCIDIKGTTNFANELPVIVSADGFWQRVKAIGFIRDAENNPAEDAFKSITKIMKDNNLPIPTAPNQVTVNTSPITGVFIMPDNAETGMLENLCLKTIEELPVYKCIENFVSCFLKYQQEEEKLIFNKSKAMVQAYLSSRSKIANSLGIGAQKGYWDLNHKAFDDIKKFLKNLFLQNKN